MISITNVLSYSPDYVVSILNERIGDIAESIGCYCADPVSDFTRSRKLPCDVLMKLIIQLTTGGAYYTQPDTLHVWKQ